MDSPNCLDLDLQFAGHPVNMRMGVDDYYARNTWDVLRHCNADFEVHILLSGSCQLEVDNQIIPFQASNGVIIAPGVFHGSRNISGEFERFCVSFMPTRQDFSQQLTEQIQTALITPLPPEAITLCRQIFDEIRRNEPFLEDAIRALFTQLLVILFRRFHLRFSGFAAPVNTANWRTSIIDAFFSPWPESFGTEEELAAILGLSCRQLNRVLVQNYGLGFRQKMLQARMAYARNLLQNTDKRIGEIGVIVGYTAESSFYKAFQNYYKMTPLQYRSLHKK